ncbi:9859_t:CDS:2 [Ambispora gerdemannii]|uniref:9859_t:CDS:1 n=1 Tax=Ambispora gerdemannii TaxID=144530 RepID=A0A9N9G6T5_9GLOM|nr:9859_t:CDS:2 [Ambispora gerdemannii]
MIFLDGYEVRSAIESAILACDSSDDDDLELPSFTSQKFWHRMVNPRFIPVNLFHYENINYATIHEAAAARKDDFEQVNYMALDVYVRKDLSSDSPKPVLLFVHGGGWTGGDKGLPYPIIFHLAEAGWIVVSTNYRLAPSSIYPNQLIDVKRAIRWVKENIHAFKGDPGFIAIAGDGAGGHLAAMAALTPNTLEYQPHFEKVDTSVNAVILINAHTDLLHLMDIGKTKNKITSYFDVSNHFSKVISGHAEINEEFLRKHSPVNLITKESVPFLVFHGDRDQYIPFESSKKFVEKLQQISKSETRFIQIPGGHHVYHLFSSPRSHYQAIGVERWLNHIYHQQLKEK